MPNWAEVGDAVTVAVATVKDVLGVRGIDPDAVVINVVWSDEEGQWAAGSKVPDDAPSLLAESLRESASEVGEGED